MSLESTTAESTAAPRAAAVRLRRVRGWLGGVPGRAVTWAGAHRLATGAVIVLAVAVAAGVIVVTGPSQPGGAKPAARYQAASKAGYNPARPPYPVRAPILMPSSYTGVYEPSGSASLYVPAATGGHATDKPPKIAVYYSGWSQGFNTVFADKTRTSGAIPLVQIQSRGVSLAAIARGTYDSYLVAFADAVAGYTGAVIIGFGQEMNEVKSSAGDQKASAASFVRAWQHIVTVFRAQNADNVTWIWTVGKVGATSSPLPDWWPGAKYVSWVGVDGYYPLPHAHNPPFAATIAGLRHLTGDPMLLFGDDKSAS